MSTTTAAGRPIVPETECNLIMKGGITSGVIYPRLASRLAQDYRLHSIGGSSAGAIAAAAAAAAELRRVRDASNAGFERLDELPRKLNEEVDGRSRLLSLFQPSRRTKPLFGVLLAVLDALQASKQRAKRPAAVGLAVVKALLAGYRGPALLGALPGIALLAWAAAVGGPTLMIGLIGGLALLAVGLVVSLVLAVKVTLTRDIPANNFGLCSGSGGTPAAPALTDWLHTYLQDTAGQQDPVTFGDLTAHRIELRTMSTNLTQGRPMAMPWSEGGFFFDPAVWRRLFPEPVVAWMLAHPPTPPTKPSDAADEADLVAKAKARGLAPLPGADDLPVVVAVRMSLSFPLLISAIPLEAARWGGGRPLSKSDAAAQDAVGAVKPRPGPKFLTNWFTDGGLCANLPVHFFDRPLATRPTFAINLQGSGSPITTPEEGSYLPTGNLGGLSRPWTTWSTQDAGGLVVFAGAMVKTWQGWVDNEALRMPGYRDRVVTIFSTADEGGLNLNMATDTVTRLAERGEAAASRLVGKFTGPFGPAPNTGFDNHRWVRLRAALAAFAEWLDAFADDLDAPAPGAALTHQQLLKAGAKGVPSYAKEGLTEVAALVDELRRLAAGGPPRPEAQPPLSTTSASPLAPRTPEDTCASRRTTVEKSPSVWTRGRRDLDPGSRRP